MNYVCRIKTGAGNNDIGTLLSFESKLNFLKDDWFMVHGLENIYFEPKFSDHDEKSYIYRVVARQLVDSENMILFLVFRQDHSYLVDVFRGV